MRRPLLQRLSGAVCTLLVASSLATSPAVLAGVPDPELPEIDVATLLNAVGGGGSPIDIGIPSSVRDLALDGQGFGWFATDAGLGRLSRSGVDHFDDRASAARSSAAPAMSIAPDPESGIWAATGELVFFDAWTGRVSPTGLDADELTPTNDGLWLLTTETATYFRHEDRAAEDPITIPKLSPNLDPYPLSADTSNQLHVADGQELITVTREGEIRRQPLPGGATAIRQRRAGGVWIVGLAGVWAFGGRYERPTLVAEAPGNRLGTDIVDTASGTVAVGTTSGEILSLDPRTGEWLGTYSTPFNDSAVTRIIAGDHGDLWFSQESTVTNVSPRGAIIDFIPFPETTPPLSTTTATTDGQTALLGTVDGSIWGYDPFAEEWLESPDYPASLAHSDPIAALALTDDHLWTALRGKVLVVTPRAPNLPPRQYGLSTVAQLAVDEAAEEIYIVSDLSVTADRYDGTRRGRQTTDSFGFGGLASAIQVTERQLYLGGLGGISIVDKSTLEVTHTFTGEGRLDDETVTSMWIQDDEFAWVALNSEILRIDLADGSTERFAISSGLSGSYISSIGPDAKRTGLWLATSIGLEFFEFETERVALALGTSSGLETTAFEPLPPLEMVDGSLLFVTDTGLVGVPAERPSGPPDLNIQLYVQCQSGCGTGFDGRTIVDSDSVRFEILSPFTTRAPVRKEYRLRGFDSDWISVTGGTSVSYQNLGEGTFTFEVRAIDSSGEVVAQTGDGPGGSIAVTNTLPFYNRPSVRAWALIIAAIAATGYLFWYRRRAEIRRLRLEALIAERTRDADEARHLAERANESKSQFLAAVTHDLRSPLTTILGYADLATLRADGAVASYVSRIATAGTHLSNLIEDLVMVARDVDRDGSPQICTVDIEEVLTDVQVMLDLSAIERGVTITTARDCPPVMLLPIEQAAVRRILMNLVSNAINHSGGTSAAIRVCWENPPERDSIRFSVSDNGGTMPVDDAMRLRDRVQRRPPPTPGGMGLGMSIVSDLVRPFGSELQLDIDPGVRTTCYVVVPASEPRDRVAPQPKRSTTKAVWVVDDEASVVDVMSAILEEKGFEVTGFASPQQALAVADSERPSCVITDIGMRPMDGIEFARHVREAFGPSVAIVAMTGLPELVALNPLFDAVLSKPTKPEQIWAVMDATVETP